MDEEYDVIVLGTGLTVSRQSGLLSALHGDKKNRAGCVNFHVVIMWAASRRRPVILRAFVAGSKKKGFLHPSEPAKKKC